jgi:hypothetical protein
MPTNPSTTLETIQAKVRRITRTPSTSQLSDTDLNHYINTFVAYDMPDHLKLFDIKTTFSFYCQPNQDVYYTDTTNVASTNVLYDFQNKYTSIDNPLLIAGYESYLSQSRAEFYEQWPLVNNITSVATGDGVTAVYTGTLNALPILPNEVTFTSVDIAGNGLTLIDDGSGTLTDPVFNTSTGTINYTTGAFTLSFPAGTPPASGQAINAQTVPYIASRPITMLFYDNKFTLRPVPDQPYKITFDVFMRPVALAANDNPQLQDWWQYIAYGAAKKILEDRTDYDSVQKIMTEFKQQERLVLRKTIVNQSKNRTPTIYTQQSGLGSGPFGWNRIL